MRPRFSNNPDEVSDGHPKAIYAAQRAISRRKKQAAATLYFTNLVSFEVPSHSFVSNTSAATCPEFFLLIDLFVSGIFKMVSLTVLCCLIAFVVGGIPFGYLVGRAILKDDIRKHGSGNIGATNVARVIGWKWGSLVLVLDAIKGLLPTLGARLFVASEYSEDAAQTATILAGIAAILGHMYPIWLKLRGGKGVATALGVVLVISPVASLVALVLFLVIAGATKIVAAASIAAATGFAITQLVMLGSHAFEMAKLPLTLFSVIVPGLIVWKHRSNIGRIIRGEENRIGKRSPRSATTSLEAPDTKV